MPCFRLTYALLSGLWLTTLIAVAQAEPPAGESQRLLDELKYLASDELEGRGVGMAGLDKAADFVANAFREAGLQVTVDNGDAFQEFEVTRGAELTSPNTLAFIGPDGKQIELTYDQDFRTCSFGTSGEFSVPIVFAGYGIDAEDKGYNDFAHIDVEGKVVIAMRCTPRQGVTEGPFSGQEFAQYAALNSKLAAARRHKAAAVLFVNDPHTGRAEAHKLAEQLEKARQSVIDAAIAFVSGDEGSGETASHDPHVDPHSPHESPAAADPHAAPATTPADPHSDVETDGDPHAPQGHGAGGLEGEASNQQHLADTVRHLQEVQGLLESHNSDPLMEFGYNGYRGGGSLPAFQITQQTADRLLQAALGTTLADLEAKIDEAGAPQSVELPEWTAQGQTSLKLVREPVRNVIGVLEGQGPLADETIVIGAHYDHIGLGGDGSMSPGVKEIHNGADDNASGTTALIELARRLASRKEPLPRRLVFIAFTGEERGLLGSAHYVKEPLFPLENTIAMFNMDMVGRLTDDKLTVFGTGTSTRWEEVLEAIAAKQGLQVIPKPEGFGPSDHSSFYAKEIPVLHFFTGTHSDYHRPTDDWEKINFDGIERVIQMMEELVVATATTAERPAYVVVKGRASIQPREGSRPYFGSIPDFSTEGSGYAIQGVSPGSPADKGGIKAGDVIIKLGQDEITSLDDFDLALRKFSPGEPVEVVVRRKGEEVTLSVTLATPRG